MVVFGKISFTLLTLALSEVRAKNCDNNPTIWISTESPKAKILRYFIENVQFGNDVTILCSAASGHLKISSDVDLKTDKINDTTVQYSARTPDVGRYEYRCTDINTQCEDTLTVAVRPAMLVTSPHAMMESDKTHDYTYFVPRGDTYKVFCTANDIQSYKLIHSKSEQMEIYLETETVNNTLVYQALANDSYDYYYKCRTKKDVASTQAVKIRIDYAPEAQNFDCVLHESLRLDCSWVTYSKMNRYRLWFLHRAFFDNRETLLCSHGHNPYETTRTCSVILNLRDVGSRKLNLWLETCNRVTCDNQTFLFYSDVITKRDVPSDLKVSNISSNSAVITWYTQGWIGYKNTEFKVEYRLLATAWRQANTSALVCQENNCNYLLHLPCSDMHYEVRVRAKSKMSIIWSDPSISRYFFTEPNSGAVDQICHEPLREPDPIVSAETGFIEVNKLIRSTIKDNRSLKRKIRALKQKTARIKSLIMLLDEL